MYPSLSYRLTWVVGHFLLLPWLKFKEAGRENVPPTGPVILASNHQSYLDPMILGCGTVRWPIQFMARDTLYTKLVAGFDFRRAHTFPVKRGGADRQAWKEFEKRVKAGGMVSFFPEGTRTEDGRLQPVIAGSGMLIHRCPGVAVVPARIRGSWRVLNKRKGFGGRHNVSVAFGPPLDLSAEWAMPAGREAYQAIAQKVMDAIAAIPLVDGRDDDFEGLEAAELPGGADASRRLEQFRRWHGAERRPPRGGAARGPEDGPRPPQNRAKENAKWQH